MKKLTKNLLAIMTALIMVMTIAETAQAANMCSRISSNNYKTVTFTVKTSKKLLSSDFIQITGKDGIANVDYTIFPRPMKDKKGFYNYFKGRYEVKVIDAKTKKTVHKKMFKGDYKIPSKMFKNKKTYKVTVKPMYPLKMYEDPVGGDNYYLLFNSWRTQPSWTITKTGKNITTCK